MASPWLPVESNPAVWNTLATKLGFPTSEYKWTDVLSLEDWGLEMIPRPVKACAMLYLIKDCHEKHREEEEAIRSAAPAAPPSLYFMEQEVRRMSC